MALKENNSAKHIGDSRGMLEVSGEAIDKAALDRWITQLDLASVWAIAADGTPYV